MNSAARLTPQALLEHQAFVLSLARSLTRDESSAEDLTQDAFVTALTNSPSDRSLRGWFASVLRNRAVDRARVEQRREARERLVARPEAQAPSASSAERLELQHSVVAAVLELDEPYRSVVIAVYYEGLTPTQYAERGGLQTSAARSQLSRALEQLRGKLDREHGDRRAWSTVLLGLLEVRRVSDAGSAAWVLWIAGLGAVGVTAAAWRWSSSPDAASKFAPALEVVESAAAEATDGSKESAAAPLDPARREVVGDTTVATLAGSALALPTEIRGLLARVRQIKSVLLDRALAVDPDVELRYAALRREPNAGVIRLLDRDRYRALTLPWMREGGAYYSFSERVHDFNRRPQLAYQSGRLEVQSDGLILDLGRVELDSLPQRGLTIPRKLDRVGAAVWSMAASELTRSESFDELRQRSARQAFDAGVLNEAEFQAVLNGASKRAELIREGHSYLLRSRSEEEFDVLVALHVVRTDEHGCTIAWRELKRWPIENERKLWTPAMQRAELLEPSAALLELSDDELWAELARTRDAAFSQLYEVLPAHVEQRFGAQRDGPGRGVARLTPYLGEWSELGHGFADGSAISLIDGRHDSSDTHLGFRGSSAVAQLSPGLDGGASGVVLDLGPIELDAVDPSVIRRVAGVAGELALAYRFASLAFDPEDPEARRSVAAAEQASVAEFERQLADAGVAREDADARVGHTYAVRTVRFEGHDVLAAVHVVALDEFGAVVAWRVLDSRRLRNVR